MEQVVDLALPEYFERISAEATFQERLSTVALPLRILYSFQKNPG